MYIYARKIIHYDAQSNYVTDLFYSVTANYAVILNFQLVLVDGKALFECIIPVEIVLIKLHFLYLSTCQALHSSAAVIPPSEAMPTKAVTAVQTGG